MLNNIIEVIDSLLSITDLKTYYNQFPMDAEGLLIECSETVPYEDIDGLDGIISSHIKLFIRVSKSKMGYVKIENLLNENYKKIYAAQQLNIENWVIERVEPFTLSSFTTDKGSIYLTSMDFNIRYKKL